MKPNDIIRVKKGKDNFGLAKFLRFSGPYLVVQKKANRDKGWHDPQRILPAEVYTGPITRIKS